MRRIYSETLPWDRVVEPTALGLLARYGLEVVLAVRPWDVSALPDVARALRDAGVGLSIWPMLADAEGRWANVDNARAFAELTAACCEALVDLPPRDVLFDLEPPFAQAKALVSFANAHGLPPPRMSRSPGYDAAARSLSNLVTSVHARGIASSMAVWPLVALDPAGASTWQTFLGTPVDPLGADHVSVMMYTSIFEGWSRGVLRRGDALALLSAATARAVRRWGPRAGMSLGCVGVGAFEDEPLYRAPRELLEDVAVVRAAGCDALTLFDLGGVLARPPAEAWLDAFTGDERVDVAVSRRVRAARAVARAATWMLGPRRG